MPAYALKFLATMSFPTFQNIHTLHRTATKARTNGRDATNLSGAFMIIYIGLSSKCCRTFSKNLSNKSPPNGGARQLRKGGKKWYGTYSNIKQGVYKDRQGANGNGKWSK